MDRVFVFVATFGHIGKLPKAPGTWASAATALIIFGAARLFHLPGLAVAPLPWLAFFALLLVLGVISAGATEKILDRPDPGCVVIDEVLGQAIAMSLIPDDPFWAFFAFVLFRMLDILKPFPVGWLDRHLHGGLGIMLDDVAAGFFALAFFAIHTNISEMKIRNITTFLFYLYVGVCSRRQGRS